MDTNFFLLFDECLSSQQEEIRKSCTYTIYHSDKDSQSTVSQVKHLIDRTQWIKTVKSSNDIRLKAGKWSHFLSLTAPKMTDLAPVLDKITLGVDALELRVTILYKIYEIILLF